MSNLRDPLPIIKSTPESCQLVVVKLSALKGCLLQWQLRIRTLIFYIAEIESVNTVCNTVQG